MKFNETVASKCRYGDNAENIWGDWNVLWEDSEDDWQGHAAFLAEKDGKYVYYYWSYGSCSGCDNWESEGLNTEQIEKEMLKEATFFDNIKQYKKFAEKSRKK